MSPALMWETIRVLESCEAKLEYLGREFMRPNFTDRYSDGPDCLHRAAKARNIINTLRSQFAAVGAVTSSSASQEPGKS